MPSTLTVASSAASSSADCVRGFARLSSSNTTTFEKIGPGRNSRPVGPPASCVGTIAPVTSPGSRSGVPWIRPKLPPTARAMHLGQQGLADARDVFDQQVAAGQQRGHGDLGDLVMAGDDGIHGGDEA